MKCVVCLPPCGGSGLKYNLLTFQKGCKKSPSMRREWIEIPDQKKCYGWAVVSLHAEGVD